MSALASHSQVEVAVAAAAATTTIPVYLIIIIYNIKRAVFASHAPNAAAHVTCTDFLFMRKKHSFSIRCFAFVSIFIILAF